MRTWWDRFSLGGAAFWAVGALAVLSFRRQCVSAGLAWLPPSALAVLACSFVVFLSYGWDKRQAVRDRRRVPEQTLHLLAFLGGWPGALFGQAVFRHKTQKVAFRAVLCCSVVVHVVGLLTGVWLSLQS